MKCHKGSILLYTLVYFTIIIGLLNTYIFNTMDYVRAKQHVISIQRRLSLELEIARILNSYDFQEDFVAVILNEQYIFEKVGNQIKVSPTQTSGSVYLYDIIDTDSLKWRISE